MKGLFGDSGIPSSEKFSIKLRKLSSKCRQDGKIVYLPKNGKVFYIDDLHGDFEAVVSIIRQTAFLEAMDNREKTFLVFLGDYGDRGSKIIETINEVITLKLRYPDNIVLLRGKHKEEGTAARYGTYEAFSRAYGQRYGELVFLSYCSAMRELPVVAIAPNGIIGVHGGIPNYDISDINVLNCDMGEIIAREMTWNDPKEGVIGRGSNIRGGSTIVFGEDAFDAFMKAVPANIMIRSHQYPRNGVDILFYGRLATIFSNGSEKSQSSAYRNYVNRAVFLAADLSERKERFQESDFIEVQY